MTALERRDADLRGLWARWMAVATGFEVRVAREDELERVVQLRWRWAIEVGEDADDEQQFIDRAAT